MWGNKISNQTATRRTAQTRVTYAVLVLFGVTATAAIHAISQPAETPPNTARFEVTSVNIPVIVRGTSGVQTITVQNKGPDAATGTQALVRPSTSTGITIASVTWGASNTTCTFSSPDYNCGVGGVANNASFDIKVTYNVATTATASTSVKQTEIRINSNEFNPGSGAGETIHKVWGALNQENPATEFGAFWAGRTSSSAICNGRGTSCGTFAGENTDVLGAWPKDSENPLGEYLQSSVNNTGNDNYKVSGTKNPTYNRIVADMPSYALNQLILPTVSGTGNSVNNRRAWEFRTYVYIPPNKSTAKFCVGADGFWVDDNAYITLSPSGSSSRTVVSTPRDAWSSNIYEVSTGGISGGGYYELIYRIVNQNAGSGSDEEAQGGYGKIGMAFDGDTCNVTNFDNAIEAGFPASITIANPTVDLSIAKSNGVTSVGVGTSTTYSIVVSNAGPSAANGALFRDIAATGLTKTSVSCTAAGGAVCPTSPTVAQVEAGLAIATLPSGGSVTFTIGANVTATSGSVANTATVTAPAGTTEINTANNSATDTDTVNGLVNIAGRVFTDNSGTTAVAANAYNATQDTGELGIAGSTVELNNCSGSVIATTQTDAAGDYSFAVTAAQLSSPNFCITQTNLTGYSSVSGTTGYVRATDTITVAKTAALTYPNHNFGDARLNLILTSDGQQTTTPSGTVSYPHILRSEAVLDVGMLNTVTSESPTLGWTTTLYRDNNCNGVIDSGEQLLTNAIGLLLPTQEICVVQRVNAPATASNGAQHVATPSASYTATVQDSGVLSGSSNTRTDTTLVGTAGLDMRKQVRVVEQCLPTVVAGVAAFSERNTAQNGDFLEYEIIYTNRSTRNLSEVRVRDFVPSNALFKAASCQSTPAGSSCSVNSQPAVDANGAVSWLVTGPVRPAATGSVRFCVQVPPLAAPPIK